LGTGARGRIKSGFVIALLNIRLIDMRTHIRFKSSKFEPLKPEEEQVNPQVYGEELAKWVYDHIGSHGLEAADYFDEDWGWMVVFGQDFPVWIGCGNVGGSKTEWLCFCETYRKLTDKILRRPLPVKELEKTVVSLFSLIKSEPEIYDIECFDINKKQQEINHGKEP